MPDVTRRALLRSVTLAGAASVGGAAGVSAHALLNDEEVFEANSLAAGSLDLQVATLTEADGNTSASPPQDDFPSAFAEDSSITVAFPDIDADGGPASGTVTVALRACDNPARVWLRADGEQSALADAIDVSASYAADCGGDSDAFFEGSLSGFFDAFGAGQRLGGCTELGKVELADGEFAVETEDGNGDSLAVEDVPGTLSLDGPNGAVALEITAVQYKDDGGEVRGVDIASPDASFCRVDVKGGGQQSTPGNNPGSQGNGSEGNSGEGNGGEGNDGGGNDGADPGGGVVTYRPDCASEVTGVVPGDNPAGEPSGLSHFVVYACERDCLGCDPRCFVLDWRISEPRTVAGESLSFDLEFQGTQCRHTEVTNPWQ